MKKFFILIFAIIMVLSMAACAEGGSASGGGGNKKTTGNSKPTEDSENGGSYSKEFFYGEWYVFEGQYGADGRVISVELRELILDEDGSAIYGDQTGTWKYRGRENIVLLALPDFELELSIVEEEDQIRLEFPSHIAFGDDYMCSFQRRNTQLEQQLQDYLTCKWYRLGSGGELETLVFEENGTVVYQNEVICQQFDLFCLGSHLFYNLDQPLPDVTLIDPDSEQLDFYTPDEEYGIFYSERIATPITVDNWREFFGEDLEESFEISYTFSPNYDDWGEVECYTCYQHFKVKNSGSYQPETTLVVEYIPGVYYYKVLVEDLAVGAQMEKVDIRDIYTPDDTPISFWIDRYDYDYDNNLLQFSELYSWIYLETEFCFMPASGTITRMKGLLIREP